MSEYYAESDVQTLDDPREMHERAMVAATLAERVMAAVAADTPVAIGPSESLRVGARQYRGADLYRLCHRHVATARQGGMTASMADHEQVDSYYYVFPRDVPARIESYEDTLANERLLLETQHFDQLKYWLGEKENIFMGRMRRVSREDAQLVGQLLNRAIQRV